MVLFVDHYPLEVNGLMIVWGIWQCLNTHSTLVSCCTNFSQMNHLVFQAPTQFFFFICEWPAAWVFTTWKPTTFVSSQLLFIAFALQSKKKNNKKTAVLKCYLRDAVTTIRRLATWLFIYLFAWDHSPHLVISVKLICIGRIMSYTVTAFRPGEVVHVYIVCMCPQRSGSRDLCNE